jgi:hypothetical protein
LRDSLEIPLRTRYIDVMANFAELVLLFRVLIKRAISSGFVDRALGDEPKIRFGSEAIGKRCKRGEEGFEFDGGLVVCNNCRE